MSKKSSVDSNNYYLYPEWFEGGNQSQPSTSSYSYPTLEYIWSNAVRLTRTVHSNLQDEIEYLEKNISGGGGSCNCSELQYGIDKNSTKIYYNSVNITSNADKIANLSDIKLSRDGSQPMEGELICNSGLKTDIIKARTQSIIDCQNQLRIYQSLGGDGDYGLWLGSDFTPEAPCIFLYPYGSSAEGKIFIKTPRLDGNTVPRIEIPGKKDLIDIKIRESNIIPYDDNYQDLGGSSNRWKSIYALSGNFSGVVIPESINVLEERIANIGSYTVTVYKDGTTIYAKDAGGNIIAQGDADIDDRDVIQAAIDALPSDGGKVALAEGIYYITESINLRSSMSFTGQGASTVLFIPDQTNPAYLPVIKMSHCVNTLVSDIKIDGNRDNQASGREGGFHINGGSHCKIVNTWICNIYGAEGNGYMLMESLQIF